MSEFEKWVAEDMPCQCSACIDAKNNRRAGYLVALRWVITRRNFYRDERKIVGVSAASQTIDDIEQEIAAVEKEKNVQE